MSYIRVKVYPNSKKEEIKKISNKESSSDESSASNSGDKGDKFEVWLREKAENNQANKKLCRLMGQYFDNPDGGVRIINGHHSRIKLLKVGKN